jgi:ribosomal protein S15P/S13E
MKVKVEKENWSQSSKQSYIYINYDEFYENIAYLCYKCGISDTFTAKEQKETFEVKKAYIWQTRYLCNKCYKDLKALKRRINEYETFWKQEKDKENVPYLLEWLSSIKELPKYRKPKNISMERKLFEIIKKMQSLVQSSRVVIIQQDGVCSLRLKSTMSLYRSHVTVSPWRMKSWT